MADEFSQFVKPSVVVASNDFDMSLEIAAEVLRTPSGNYNIHIEDLNGSVEIPMDILMDIAQFVKDEAKQADAAPYALTDQHVASLERAIRAEGYDIRVDTDTGEVKLYRELAGGADELLRAENEALKQELSGWRISFPGYAGPRQ